MFFLFFVFLQSESEWVLQLTSNKPAHYSKNYPFVFTWFWNNLRVNDSKLNYKDIKSKCKLTSSEMNAISF